MGGRIAGSTEHLHRTRLPEIIKKKIKKMSESLGTMHMHHYTSRMMVASSSASTSPAKL
jgi:hypothetical protein